MQVDRVPIQLFEKLISVKAFRDLIGFGCAVAHDEKQGLLAALLPFIAAQLPSLVSQQQMLLIDIRSVFARLFIKPPISTANDGCFDDSAIYGFAQR